MAVEAAIRHVHRALEKFGMECPLEVLLNLCPDLTWNQVFLAIDHLSRTGQVSLIADQHWTYRVQVLRPPAPSEAIS